MPTVRILRLLAAVFVFFGMAAIARGDEPPVPGPDARCAVCGMSVAPYPNWTASIVFKDGTQDFFDGPKDMFVFFFDLGSYRPGAKPQDIADLFVTEYYTTRRISAREVYFVSGSDVMGPMGGEMVPVAGQENAQTFLRDHHGRKLMQWDGEKLSEVRTEK